MLRYALQTDLDAVAELYVDAFATDPFLWWIQPDDDRWPAFGRAWFGFVLDLTLARGHTYVPGDADAFDVATAWVPPDVALVAPDDLARGAAVLHEHGGPERGPAALDTILAARAHALDESHWTLQYVGVRSSAQGCGQGAAALAPMLLVVDTEHLPSALTSTNPRNLAFYERLGFAVVAEVTTPDGAATLRPMVRPAR